MGKLKFRYIFAYLAEIIFFLTLFGALIFGVYSFYTYITEAPKVPRVEDYRFVIISKHREDYKDEYELIYDKYTYIMYVHYTNTYSGGITVLFDKDGKPMIYEDAVSK